MARHSDGRNHQLPVTAVTIKSGTYINKSTSVTTSALRTFCSACTIQSISMACSHDSTAERARFGKPLSGYRRLHSIYKSFMCQGIQKRECKGPSNWNSVEPFLSLWQPIAARTPSRVRLCWLECVYFKAVVGRPDRPTG